MKRFILLCSLPVLLLSSGCALYETVTIRTRTGPHGQLVIYENPEDENFRLDRITAGLKHCDSPRYLVKRGSSRASSIILSAGVEEALKGNFYSAEILFMELIGREKNGAAENNLAVASEQSGKCSLALEMYTRAIYLDPENTLYRKNLYYFICSGALSRGDANK